MSNEKREQQMMDAADRYADEVCDESCTGAQVADTINDFCAGWRASDSYPNWISVEDELPPKMDKWTKASDYVLVYTNEGEWLIGRYWHDGDGWSVSGFIKAKVTYWMEIVPPRKEDKK